MQTIQLNEQNTHVTEVNGKQFLFHVPTTSIFQMDSVSNEIIATLKNQAGRSFERHQILGRLGHKYSLQEITGAVDELMALDILRDRDVKIKEGGHSFGDYPLSSIVLNLNTGCNLSCTYCYKEDLVSAAKGDKMTLDTARKSIDLLIKESKTRHRINVIFFGGEPLTRFDLIKEIVGYSLQRGREAGKVFDFSLTTNGTMLTESMIDYFNEQRFGISVSIDGPKAIHDKNRITVSGQGTYDVVRKKVDMLLGRYTARPVGARVTLTRGVTDVIGIHRHLKEEVGFYEVGFAPATSGDLSQFNLKEDELVQVFDGMKTLGRAYLDAALSGRNNGFSNMHQLMTDLYQGTKKSLPCGAGLGLLSVDTKGGLNLCHRFTGSEVKTWGDVDNGIDHGHRVEFLEAAADLSGKPCETCRIRHLCGGGCYHESYIKQGDLLSPVYHYCELMKDWIDFGVGTFTRIMDEAPEFFPQHIEPRTPQHETLASR